MDHERLRERAGAPAAVLRHVEKKWEITGKPPLRLDVELALADIARMAKSGVFPYK